MRTGDPVVSILSWLSQLPLLDRLELAALSGWSRSAVYRAVESLERERLVEPLAHASDLIAPTRRFTLTAAGLRRLAESEGISAERLLHERPVSEQARRRFLGRIDALAVLYRLCCTLADIAFPIQIRCYRAMPVDLCLRLADGRTIALVRLGRINERRSLARRLGRLRDGAAFAAVLLVAPDETRLRETARRLRSFPQPCFLALERDAAKTGPESLIWRAPSAEVALSLREALDLAGPHRLWPTERPPAHVSAPAVKSSGCEPTDWMLAARLGPSEKRCLDLIGDWPWLRLDHLTALLGVSRVRLRGLLRRAGERGLIVRAELAGRPRLALSDRGLAVLARRDRASVGELRKRWSAESIAHDAAFDWRNIKGTRSRQLLRHLDHTEAVHGFLTALAEQSRKNSLKLIQLDPPQRASRYFRYQDRLRSIQPDAFGVLRREGRDQPFFLEWERRAIRPSTMALRLAPYLRYYASRRPVEDHGGIPIVLVVFERGLAADHFRRVVREERQRTGLLVPICISDRNTVAEHGPLGDAWRSTDHPGPGLPLD
ncbi:MAG: MarR family winged helix-turn-helix transcriptional regulator [Chloroflexota bacterium]|nr:MarR family winged helix-turn-helix transcriptional regulator [Chloroflexota bacterium]